MKYGNLKKYPRYMDLRCIYRRSILVSPPDSVIGLPILSDHLALKLRNHLCIREPLDIMAESNILTQA